MWSRTFLWPTCFAGCVYLISLGCPARADLYRWTDARGVIHIVDESVDIPEIYQGRVKIYRSFSSHAESSPAFIAPSGIYSARSQGAFAQKIALDFGLITDGSLDALGPLSGVGIQPAGGWKVRRALDPDSVDQLAAAVRRAATTQRLALSADGAEAIIRQAALDFIPPPPEPVVQEEPAVIIIEQPPHIIEIIHEPYYVETPVVVHALRPYRPYQRLRRFPRQGRREREVYRPPHTIQRRNPSIRPSKPSISRRTPGHSIRPSGPSISRRPLGHSIRRGPFIANTTTQAAAPFIRR